MFDEYKMPRFDPAIRWVWCAVTKRWCVCENGGFRIQWRHQWNGAWLLPPRKEEVKS